MQRDLSCSLYNCNTEALTMYALFSAASLDAGDFRLHYRADIQLDDYCVRVHVLGGFSWSYDLIPHPCDYLRCRFICRLFFD